jgi:cobalt-zinc-cadmium efflux system membrane fusion protein
MALIATLKTSPLLAEAPRRLLLCVIALSMPLVGCKAHDAEAIAAVATSDDEEQESSEGEGEDEICKEHQVLEDECGICHPQKAETLRTGQELKVRFESTKAVSKAGLQTAKPRVADTQPSVRVVSEVSYNENKLARITPVVAGIVREVYVDAGQSVEAGDALIQIHSAEIASAKTALISLDVDATLQSQECRRERRLAKKKISSTRDLQVAEAACRTAAMAVNMARQKLLNLGFTDAEIEKILQQQDASALFTIRAPLSGTIVYRNAVVGEVAQTGEDLFKVADLSTMWLSLSIPPDKADKVQVGMHVIASFGSSAPTKASGVITWIAASFGERSRMLIARATVDNADRKLRAGMFGYATILTGPTHESAVTLPTDAVQQFENKPYVFVKLEEDLYSLRRIQVYDRSEERQVSITGVRPTEDVVVVGAFTAMSEFLKSRLGAGCVDE